MKTNLKILISGVIALLISLLYLFYVDLQLADITRNRARMQKIGKTTLVDVVSAKVNSTEKRRALGQDSKIFDCTYEFTYQSKNYTGYGKQV